MKRQSFTYGICLAIFIAIVCGFVLYIYRGIEFVEATVRPRYAVQWTSSFIIEHLKNSDNQWPTEWEDLRDEFDTMAEPSHYAWSFDELQTLVDVRWDITLPDDMDAFDDATKTFVSIKRDNKYAHVLKEDVRVANQQIRDYLRESNNNAKRE